MIKINRADYPVNKVSADARVNPSNKLPLPSQYYCPPQHRTCQS